MTLPTPAHLILSLGGAADQAVESFPSPTLFVVVYAAGWLALVAWIAWLAGRQHRLRSDTRNIEAQLQARLDQSGPDSPDAD